MMIRKIYWIVGLAHLCLATLLLQTMRLLILN